MSEFLYIPSLTKREVLQASLVCVEHADNEMGVIDEFRSGMNRLLAHNGELFTDLSMCGETGRETVTEDDLLFAKARAAFGLFEQALFSGAIGTSAAADETIEQYHGMQDRIGVVPVMRHKDMWFDRYKQTVYYLSKTDDQRYADDYFEQGRQAVGMARRFGLSRLGAFAARGMLAIQH